MQMDSACLCQEDSSAPVALRVPSEVLSLIFSNLVIWPETCNPNIKQLDKTNLIFASLVHRTWTRTAQQAMWFALYISSRTEIKRMVDSKMFGLYPTVVLAWSSKTYSIGKPSNYQAFCPNPYIPEDIERLFLNKIWGVKILHLDSIDYPLFNILACPGFANVGFLDIYLKNEPPEDSEDRRQMATKLKDGVFAAPIASLCISGKDPRTTSKILHAFSKKTIGGIRHLHLEALEEQSIGFWKKFGSLEYLLLGVFCLNAPLDGLAECTRLRDVTYSIPCMLRTKEPSLTFDKWLKALPRTVVTIGIHTLRSCHGCMQDVAQLDLKTAVIDERWPALRRIQCRDDFNGYDLWALEHDGDKFKCPIETMCARDLKGSEHVPPFHATCYHWNGMKSLTMCNK